MATCEMYARILQIANHLLQRRSLEADVVSDMNKKVFAVLRLVEAGASGHRSEPSSPSVAAPLGEIFNDELARRSVTLSRRSRPRPLHDLPQRQNYLLAPSFPSSLVRESSNGLPLPTRHFDSETELHSTTRPSVPDQNLTHARHERYRVETETDEPCNKPSLANVAIDAAPTTISSKASPLSPCPPSISSLPTPSVSQTSSPLTIHSVGEDQPDSPSRQMEMVNDTAVDDTWTRKRLRPRTCKSLDVVGSDYDWKESIPRECTAVQGSQKRKRKRTSDGISNISAPTPSQYPSTLAEKFGLEDTTSELEKAILQLGAQSRHTFISFWQQRSQAVNLADLSSGFQFLPCTAKEIEDSPIHAQLSRFRTHVSLGDFHRFYRAAQARPDEFLQQIDKILPRDVSHQRPRNWSKRAEAKDRIRYRIFQRPRNQTDSTRIQDWQNWGRRWSKLVEIHGPGILWLAPEELNNSKMRSLDEGEFQALLYRLERPKPKFETLLATVNDLLQRTLLSQPVNKSSSINTKPSENLQPREVHITPSVEVSAVAVNPDLSSIYSPYSPLDLTRDPVVGTLINKGTGGLDPLSPFSGLFCSR